MTTPTRHTCGCKVNIGLRITGKRANGYHELDSFFYPLSAPCDTLTLEFSEKPGITVATDCPEIDPANNTLTKLYNNVRTHLAAQKRVLPGVHVTLHKDIPLGAGLGGGSSDAATLLAALNTHLCLNLTVEECTSIAAKTGADVPFFMNNTPARIQGIGERTSPATLTCFPCWLLLLCPKMAIDTPWAYQAFDNLDTETKKTSNGTETFATTLRSLGEERPWSCTNDLEAPVLLRYPELAAYKKLLWTDEVLAVGMSGSGAALYALFPFAAKEACDAHATKLAAAGHTCFVHALT